MIGARWSRGTVKVAQARLKDGHLLLVQEGKVVDLGECTLEDLKVLSYVTQEAYGRLTVKRRKHGASTVTLARVKNFADRLYSRAHEGLTTSGPRA